MIDHDDSRQFLCDMQNIAERGNSDYALHRTHYLPVLGQRMLDTWRRLNAQGQQTLGENRQRCGEILCEKQQEESLWQGWNRNISSVSNEIVLLVAKRPP